MFLLESLVVTCIGGEALKHGWDLSSLLSACRLGPGLAAVGPTGAPAEMHSTGEGMASCSAPSAGHWVQQTEWF